MDVTVILLTYNHERFLAQAIDSILVQRTRGAFELMISEDCSTDGTREVIQGYLAQHPECIRVFVSESNLNSNEVTLRALRAARGRYVAFLDGDDYWTCDEKLQRQVDFLDAHQQCAMCFHNAVVFREDGTAAPRKYTPSSIPRITELPALLRGNYIAGCSPMIRRDVLTDIPAWYEHAPYGDWPLFVFAAQRGSIAFLPEVMGAYRVHERGLWSSSPRLTQLEGLIRFYLSISAHLGVPYHRNIIPLLAARYFDLGVAHQEAGRHPDAVECFVRSLRVRPFTRAIPPGRRTWRLARLGMCALAGRGFTVREAFSAVLRSCASAGTPAAGERDWVGGPSGDFK